MCALRRENVQLHCRTCLSDLQTKVDEIGLPRRWFHLQTTDHLANWIQNLTSLNVHAMGSDYPQFVCQECYDMFKDFCEFKIRVLTAAKNLNEVLQSEGTGGSDTVNVAGGKCVTTTNMKHKDYIKSELNCDDDDDDVYNHQQSEYFNKDDATTLQFKIQESFKQIDGEHVQINPESTSVGDNPLNREQLQSGGEHGAVSTTAKTYKCEHCNRQFSHKYTYIGHVRQAHQGVRNAYECEHCSKSYTKFCNLYRHIRQEHSSSLRLFKCEYPGCHRGFRHLTTRRKHYQEFHQRLKRPPTPPTPPDSTLLLPELLLPADIAPPPLTAPPKRFNCSLCGEQFETLYNLQSHMIEHRDDLKFVCGICGKRKISQVKLDEHYATVHDPRNAYPCNICHKIFKCKSHVSVHIMSVHKGLRPFACHYCPMQFAAKNTLKIHERLHTGEKPFACEICGRRFTQLTPMKKHRLIHDKEHNQHLEQQQLQQHQELMSNTALASNYTTFGN